MTKWARFDHKGEVGFGIVDNDSIAVHVGDMFDAPADTGVSLRLADVDLLMPTEPTKMVAMWNNFHALAAKLDVAEPEEPLFFLKANNSFLGPNRTIHRPRFYDGKVGYEGELGIVIGKTCTAVAEADALDYVFGYTCINDVTALELIFKDKTFPQWARAKGFDTFGVFGPVIETDLDPAALVVKTVLNGDERQNYPISDMIFPVPKLVSKVSEDMTLMAGDIIACGTSVGVGSMKEKSNDVAITIDGIGTLSNVFE